MTSKNSIEVLKQNLNQAEQARKWLVRSYNKCRVIDVVSSVSDDQFDDLENLASRFSRLVDIYIQKVFRSIDSVELEDGGSILDVVNRADKRQLFGDINDIKLMKDLRNSIAHEYLVENLLPLYQEILKMTPILLAALDQTREYCRRYTSETKPKLSK